ncbi:MAG: AAA family ATPase, partial [Deinococcota bacterium]|nr:AAA family ATPase [Deinococcota bacterium]
MGEATTKNGDRLEVKLLGAPGLRWRGAAIEPATAKDLALLYYLAARPEGAARDELQELLWGVGRRRNLRQALYSLRQLAGADGWLRVGETISLEAGSDLAAFREAVRDRRYGDALELWRTAAAPRGREALLSGFALKRAPAFADWLEVERARLEAHYLDALKCRALELEEEGRYAEALSLTRTLLGEDGLNESAYRAAMRLHYRRGDIEAALSLFETCRRALAEDLGVEPLEETLELVRAIERGRGLESRQEDTPSLLPARGRIPAQLLRPPVLVGREAVWAALDEAWRAGKTIFLCGPAGTGKTRLMLDFVRAQGGFLLSEGRPGDAAVPYSSVARALQRALEGVPLELEDWVRQELARLLPQRFLELSPPRLETADAKHRFMQAIGRVMDGLRAQVSAVAIDDLHHCDGASREVGMMLAARFAQAATPGGARMLIAFRGDELDSAQRSGLGGLVAAGQAVLVALEPLEPAAVKAMLTSLEVPGAAALAARLHRYTGGNPMFVVETLKGMYAGGDFSGTFSSGPPGRVGAVMQGRLGALSATALKLAGAVAVGQAQAETGLLAEVLGLDALTVALALGELEDAQIMAAGRFVHDLWPEMLLATMPAALKTFWHRRTALALEARGETARGETAQGEP